MNQSTTASSRPLPPDAARGLVVDLEHLGIEASAVSVETSSPVTTRETARVDQASFARPSNRVAQGAAIGAALGLLAAAIIAFSSDATFAQALPAIIAGVALGGLAGLYSRLPLNRDVAAVDSGGPSVITIDLRDLSQDQVDRARNLVDNAAHSRTT